jgi:hypothetical protein
VKNKVVFNDISRKQAFLTHLFASMAIFLVLIYLIAFEWFPSFYYRLDNGYIGTAVIFFVDVVLGPGLTLLVFKPGKKSLKFDMTVILILQLVALGWGVKSVYEDRPALTVFYYGKMILLSQSGIKKVDMDSIENGVSGSQKLGFLRTPDGITARRGFTFEALKNNSSEIFYYGSKIEPVSESNMQRITQYKLDIDAVEKGSSVVAAVLKKYIETHPGYQERYHFYPIRGRFNAGIAVLDSEAMRITEVLDVQTSVVAVRMESEKPAPLSEVHER